tara:strand:- start:3467 stop:4231 length:765 start_codon:yes stop_codon:yes gene_type:complete
MYLVGNQYTRADIYEILNVPKDKQRGDWLNGYHRHDNDYYIFCNVGVAGRTGHDYDNHWDGDKLVWHGKTKSNFSQNAIKNLLSSDYRCLIFYRSEDRSPFTYAGVGHPIPHYSIEKPARIDWIFQSLELPSVSTITDEYQEGVEFKEGTRIKVYVNKYERDRKARDKCIEHYGATCRVCDLNFNEIYGELGDGFIHVHHKVQISDVGESYIVNPIEDLIPVCPNCHAMLHKENPPIKPEQLRELVLTRKGRVR